MICTKLSRIPLQPLASLFASLISCIHFGKLCFSSNQPNENEISGLIKKENYLLYIIFISSSFIVIFDIILLFISVNKKRVNRQIKQLGADDRPQTASKYYRIIKWIIFVSSSVEFGILFVDFLIKTPQGILQYGNMIEKATGKKASSFNNYGNWCTFSGSGTPVDSIDMCCYWHSSCYSNISFCEIDSSVYLDRNDFYFDAETSEITC